MGDFVSLTSKGQITLPKDIREKLSLRPGDMIAWTIVDDHLVGTPRNLEFADLAGILGDPPGGPATLEEIDTAVREAVGRHVAGEQERDGHEDAA
jgi:antitoxin PrlF